MKVSKLAPRDYPFKELVIYVGLGQDESAIPVRTKTTKLTRGEINRLPRNLTKVILEILEGKRIDEDIRLTPKPVHALRKRFVDRMSLEEIVHDMGIKVKSIQTLLKRGEISIYEWLSKVYKNKGITREQVSRALYRLLDE